MLFLIWGCIFPYLTHHTWPFLDCCKRSIKLPLVCLSKFIVCVSLVVLSHITNICTYYELLGICWQWSIHCVLCQNWCNFWMLYCNIYCGISMLDKKVKLCMSLDLQTFEQYAYIGTMQMAGRSEVSWNYTFGSEGCF